MFPLCVRGIFTRQMGRVSFASATDLRPFLQRVASAEKRHLTSELSGSSFLQSVCARERPLLKTARPNAVSSFPVLFQPRIKNGILDVAKGMRHASGGYSSNEEFESEVFMMEGMTLFASVIAVLLIPFTMDFLWGFMGSSIEYSSCMDPKMEDFAIQSIRRAENSRPSHKFGCYDEPAELERVSTAIEEDMDCEYGPNWGCFVVKLDNLTPKGSWPYWPFSWFHVICPLPVPARAPCLTAPYYFDYCDPDRLFHFRSGNRAYVIYEVDCDE